MRRQNYRCLSTPYRHPARWRFLFCGMDCGLYPIIGGQGIHYTRLITLELPKQSEELRQDLADPLLVQCLHHQKAVELLLGKVQRVQHGVLSQVLMQPCRLHGTQLPVMAAHEAEQPPVPASLGVVLVPQLQEVLINAQYLRTGPARELANALLHKRLIPTSALPSPCQCDAYALVLAMDAGWSITKLWS